VRARAHSSGSNSAGAAAVHTYVHTRARELGRARGRRLPQRIERASRGEWRRSSHIARGRGRRRPRWTGAVANVVGRRRCTDEDVPDAERTGRPSSSPSARAKETAMAELLDVFSGAEVDGGRGDDDDHDDDDPGEL
jgi:hypothetical protein